MTVDGREVSGGWGVPFILILVILSIVPQVFPHFWHKWWIWVSNTFLVSIILGLFAHFGADFGSEFIKILMEYEGFMCLIFSLFVTSSGVRFTSHLRLRGNPTHNSALILIAAFFSNIMGSSGATLLFIRPLVASNKWRQHAGQTFVFFIYIVCNAGASLSPMGDPPLFVGYIKGVPFFWWLTHLIGPSALCVGLLMLVYLPIEVYNYRREPNRATKEAEFAAAAAATAAKHHTLEWSAPQKAAIRNLFGAHGSVESPPTPTQKMSSANPTVLEQPVVIVPPTDKAIQEAFVILDVDGSGRLETGKWEQIGTVLGRPFSREDLDAMHHKYGSEGLTADQFVDMCKSKFGVSADTESPMSPKSDIELGGVVSKDYNQGLNGERRNSSSQTNAPKRQLSQAEHDSKPDRFPALTAVKIRFDAWCDGIYKKHSSLRYIDGWRNLPLLFAVPVVTFLTGVWADTAQPVFEYDNCTYLVSDLTRDLLLFFIGVFSYFITSEKTRKLNEFSWGPIIEVVILFSSIFATMLPCIIMLSAGKDGALSGFISGLTKSDGNPNNLAYYWVSGILSAFLDNTPEFIVLYDVALNAIPIPWYEQINFQTNGGDPSGLRSTLLQEEFATTLAAVAAGSVYFGGLTYIGNAPNFFVKNIAEGEKIKLPSFLGFMAWSVCTYIPVLAIVGAVFFNS